MSPHPRHSRRALCGLLWLALGCGEGASGPGDGAEAGSDAAGETDGTPAAGDSATTADGAEGDADVGSVTELDAADDADDAGDQTSIDSDAELDATDAAGDAEPDAVEDAIDDGEAGAETADGGATAAEVSEGGPVDSDTGGDGDALVPTDGDMLAPDDSDAAAEVVPDPDAGADTETADLAQPATLEIDPATLPEAPFVDISQQFGAVSGAVYGPCVAVADFDGNGFQDFVTIVIASGNKTSIRATLLSAGPPQFVSGPFDTTVMQPNFACAAADMNGDNKPDLLFSGFSGAAIYLGDGKGTFKDASAAFLPYIMDFAAFGIVPIDLDGDLDLDLFIPAGFDPPPCTHLQCQFTSSDLLCTLVPPMKQTIEMQDRVLIRGPQLPMVDATKAWKVPAGGNQTVAAAVDIDDDGKIDVLVGDDMGSHRLLHNLGGSFASYEQEIGFHPYAGAMGWAIGDLNDDGLLDVVLAESGPTPVFAGVKPKPGLPAQFEDIGGQLGLWWTTWGASAWSPHIADFDLDGRDDLLVGVSANFSKAQAEGFSNVCIASRGDSGFDPFAGVPSLDLLYLRDGDKGWKGHKFPAGIAPHVVFLEQALLDLDGDGDLDVVQTRPGVGGMMPVSVLRVLRNDLSKKGGSFRVVVRGKGNNQDALGAVVSATIGGVVRKRLLYGSGGFGGTATRFAYFGLGAWGKATSVKVRWPDGKETALPDGVPGATYQALWP